MSENKEGKFREALQSKVKSAEDVEKTAEVRPAPGTAPAAKAQPQTGHSLMTQNIAIFGPRVRDMAVFCRQLATLLEVGIPLVRSLRILAERSQHPKLKKVSEAVARDVEEGRRLSEAFAKHPRIFPALLVNVARVGESGGILEPSLNRLADTMEQKLIIRRKIVGAMMYPVAAIVIAFCVLLLILTYAIPIFAEVYRESNNADLPAITEAVIAMSDFARSFWWLYIPLILLVIAGLYLFGKTPGGKRIYDWLRLKSPIVGGINTKIAVARTMRNLGNLVSAGIPLMESLSIVSKTSENVIVGEALGRARDNVERGGKMDEPLRRTGVFPPMVIDMVTIGDEAGALDTMLLKVADIYDADVDAALKGLSSLIEPLLIVLLGGAVITIALAVLLPYFRLASVVGVE